MTSLPPIRRAVLVETSPADAFRVFTERIGSWWPLARLSVFGAGADVGFADGELVEVSPAGERSIWGTVLEWQPGERLAFTWHPGKDADDASRVEVGFSVASDEQTLVTLVHDGWESFADPATARAEYGLGWPPVLAEFVREAHPVAPASTWVALLHSPGPAAPSDGNVFSAPAFADHVSFLERMDAAGYLVAAGPLPDNFGSGMTVLRLAGPEAVDEARRLATADDASVVGGLLTVEVREWDVMFGAGR